MPLIYVDKSERLLIHIDKNGRWSGWKEIACIFPELELVYAHLHRPQFPQKQIYPRKRMTRSYFSTEHGARWRWLVYVALAFIGGLLTFAGARAQQRASDDATFRGLIDAYCAAWSSGDANAPAKFYAKDNSLVFYDITPFSYRGWKEYHDGVEKAIFANMASGSLTAGKDLKVTRRGAVAWTTVPMHFSEKTKDGKSIEIEVRYTGIWEKHGANWLLVHEHLSTPLGG
jgi:ketosteroid isomerase-like protein